MVATTATSLPMLAGSSTKNVPRLHQRSSTIHLILNILSNSTFLYENHVIVIYVASLSLVLRIYHCSLKCDFIVDLMCGINPLPPTIEQPKSHNHSVVFLKEPAKPGWHQCKICKGYNFGCSYACHECEVHFHVECVDLSQEVNHPSHPQHPLELLAYESLTSGVEKRCLLCGERPNKVLYCCSIIICRFCTKNPPPLAIDHHKTHEHQLVLLSRQISSYFIQSFLLIYGCKSFFPTTTM